METMLTMSSDDQTFPAYKAEPGGTPKGGIVLIEEVWGLNDHIKSIADRFASEGYIVLAPDLLSETDIATTAGTLQFDLFNPATRNEAQPKMRTLTSPLHAPDFANKSIIKLRACFDHLYEDPKTLQRVAVCGFCFGGTYSFSLAMAESRLKVAIPFYGHVTNEVRELKRINCPVRAFYGEKDIDLMQSLPELKEGMEAAAVDFQAVTYPDCGHAFFNDTNPYSYNEAAAKDAWQHTLTILTQYLA